MSGGQRSEVGGRRNRSGRLERWDYCSDAWKWEACPECGCTDFFRITPVAYFGCGLEVDRIVTREGDLFRVASACRRKDKRGVQARPATRQTEALPVWMSTTAPCGQQQLALEGSSC